MFSHDRLIISTWIKENKELEANILWNIKLEVNKLAEDGVETVSVLCGPKQSQGKQVEFLTVWQCGLVLKGEEMVLEEWLLLNVCLKGYNGKKNSMFEGV